MNALIPLTFQSQLTALAVNTVASASAKHRYAVKLRKFFTWWEARGTPHFCRAVVLEYVEWLRSQGKPPFDLLHSLTPIKKMAQEAVFNGLIPADQVFGIAEIKLPAVRSKRIKNRLSGEQVVDMIAAVDTSTLTGIRDMLAIGLMLHAGLRRTEAVSVRAEDVALVANCPVVHVERGKGGAARTIPIPAWLYEMAQEWPIREGYLLRSINKWGGVGERLSGSACWLITQRYGKCSPHDLRRTLGAMARRAGRELDEIQEVYGHQDITTTQGYIGSRVDVARPLGNEVPKPIDRRDKGDKME